ncbi:hypothetical protein ACFL07_01535 [Pseudomonadota bacterium]
MTEYIMPILFLMVVFVVFALVHRNRNSACAGCSGDCDKTSCENRS